MVERFRCSLPFIAARALPFLVLSFAVIVARSAHGGSIFSVQCKSALFIVSDVHVVDGVLARSVGDLCRMVDVRLLCCHLAGHSLSPHLTVPVSACPVSLRAALALISPSIPWCFTLEVAGDIHC